MSTQTKDLLIEIGTEELPPKALKSLSDAFTAAVVDGLNDESLQASEVLSYAAPRRLAILLKDIPAKQADQSVERKGPAKTAAFDEDGNPTKAVEGFARSCGVSAFDLEEIETPKGIWLVFRQEVAGKDTAELVPDIVSKALAKLPIPKRMRWGASDIEFVRPVHWVVMMLDDQVIEAEILGVKSGNTTKGHRFHHPDAITIKTASSYAEQLLKQGSVIASFEDRRDEVRDQAEAVAKKLGGIAQIDASLLDEVTALIELPIAVSGSFDEEFLQVPQECLISSMQDHQKYFPVIDANNKLLPYFITTSNINSSNPKAVSQGNERVIRPRFADAKFFWDQDCKVKLESHREATKKIIFQQKLGTLFDKTERVSQLAAFIAEEIGSDKQQAMRAAELSKCDLLSNMVQEFPELQGIMGSYYAKHDNEDVAVAAAMQEQYQPAFAGDVIPAGEIGKIVSLADRIDTIMGIFAIDMKPTGSKDPFSLRRAALGALRIMIEGDINIPLPYILEISAEKLQNKVNAHLVVEEVNTFILERLKNYYQNQKINAEEVDAVIKLGFDRLPDIDKRIKALASFSKLPEAKPLAAANKRISNILKNAEYKSQGSVREGLFKENEEKSLLKSLKLKQAEIGDLVLVDDYLGILTSLSSLKPTIDDFFENVMVLDEDEEIRNNRLALISEFRNMFLQVADLSRL